MIEYGMSFNDYANLEGMNASKLKQGRKSMRAMKSYADHGMVASATMQLGTLIHSAVLEPELFGGEVIVWDGGIKKGKAWTEFKAEHEGKQILKPEELADIFAIKEAVWANPTAAMLIRQTQHEVSLQWENELGMGKCRADGYNEQTGLVVELKTGSDISPRGFTNIAYRLGYHLAGGWTRMGLQALGLKYTKYVIICVEQKRPHDVIVYDVTEDWMNEGEKEATEIAKKWNAARVTGDYAGQAEDGLVLGLPGWVGDDKEIDISNGTMEASEL